MIEFMAQELGTYAIVYKTKSETVPFISSLHEKVEPTVSERREPYKPNSENTSPRKAGDTLMSVPNSKQDDASQGQLPKTNAKLSSYLLFLAGLSLVLAATFLEKKKTD